MTQYSDITRFFSILRNKTGIPTRLEISSLFRLNTLFLALILLTGCQSNSVERERTGNDRFKTTAPSFIYFKNIRSIKYQTSRNPKTQMDFYRPKVFMNSNKIPIIYPIIIHNWLEDESYLSFERKNIEETAKILLNNEVGDTIQLDWPTKDYLDQLEFVRQLDNNLQSEKNIFIQEINKERITLKYSLTERTSFRAVLQDFLNLTETASSRANK